MLRALLAATLAAPACAVSPAPTVEIAPGVMLPYVAMGTGSGQHGNVSNATALWLGSSAGVAIDTSIIYKDEPASCAESRNRRSRCAGQIAFMMPSMHL